MRELVLLDAGRGKSANAGGDSMNLTMQNNTMSTTLAARQHGLWN